MASVDYFLNKTLGEDFFESLQKFDLWKPGTKTVVDHQEIKTALHIVPRTVLSMLIRELTPMEIGDKKEIKLPFGPNVMMIVSKYERDVYSGEIFEDNKKVVNFMYRSIPGVGLVIMSAFELYNVDELKQEEPVDNEINGKVQQMIDERIALHELVNKVVEKKLEQRDAVNKLLLMRLTQELAAKERIVQAAMMVTPTSEDCPIVHAIEKNEKKKSPLKGFLESRKKKQEFSIKMAKGETVDCPDCGKNIFNGNLFSGCICLGDDREKTVFIKKTEDGIKVSFSKSFDIENIEMILQTLRRKNV